MTPERRVLLPLLLMLGLVLLGPAFAVAHSAGRTARSAACPADAFLVKGGPSDELLRTLLGDE